MLAIILLSLLLTLAPYFLKAYGLFCIGKNGNLKRAFVAFIPPGSEYMTGVLVDDDDRQSNARIILPIYAIINFFYLNDALSRTMFSALNPGGSVSPVIVLTFVRFVMFIYYLFVMHKLYAKFCGQSTAFNYMMIYTGLNVLSFMPLLGGFLKIGAIFFEAIVIFGMRDYGYKDLPDALFDAQALDAKYKADNSLESQYQTWGTNTANNSAQITDSAAPNNSAQYQTWSANPANNSAQRTDSALTPNFWDNHSNNTERVIDFTNNGNDFSNETEDTGNNNGFLGSGYSESWKSGPDTKGE